MARSTDEDGVDGGHESSDPDTVQGPVQTLVGGTPHRGARIVFAAGVLAGLVYLVHKLTTEAWMVGIDFRVYRAAAEMIFSTGQVYGPSQIGIPGMTYRYPPVVLLGFAPSVLVPWRVGYVLHTLVVLAASLALSRLLVRYVTARGVELARLDEVLIAGFVVGSAHALPSMVFGQVNHFVALGLALGFVWVETGRERRAGAAFALAALPKAFPAAVGVWLLSRRAYRAVASALATGFGLLGLGLVVFGPDVTRRWVTEELLARLRPGLFAGGLPPSSHLLTVRRPLSVLFPTVDPGLYSLGALALLAPVLGYLLLGVETGSDTDAGDKSQTEPEAGVKTVTDGDADVGLARLVAIFGTMATILLFFPSTPLYVVYLYFPLVPLLYLLDGPGRSLFLAGAFLLNFPAHRNDLVMVLAETPPGSAVDNVILSVLGPVFALGSPMLYGFALLLAGCVRWRYRSS